MWNLSENPCAGYRQIDAMMVVTLSKVFSPPNRSDGVLDIQYFRRMLDTYVLLMGYIEPWLRC